MRNESRFKEIFQGLYILVGFIIFCGLLFYVPDCISSTYYNYKIRSELNNNMPKKDIEKIIALKEKFKKICTKIGSVCKEESHDFVNCKGKLTAIVEQKKKIFQKNKLSQYFYKKLSWYCNGKNHMIHAGF